MMQNFKINPEDLKDNVFQLIGSDWMLVTAGYLDSYNTMTAAWGGFGVLWHKNVCYIFIRKNRHTFDFINNNKTFTLCFFNEEYRDVLKLCGSKSGKDFDKIAETGITPIESKNGSVYFKEAKLIIEAKKMYFQDLDPENFLDEEIEKIYPNKDYHRMFIGEITDCLIS